MPIVPNALERLTLRLNLAPALMLDLLGAQAFRVTCVAYRLGVFEELRSGAATTATLARRIEADERGMTLLLGRGHDVALVFNILHGFTPDRNVALLKRVAEALVPGGLLVILDQIEGRATGPIAKAVTRLQALNMFNAAAGQTYPPTEMLRWLQLAGFMGTRHLSLFRSPGLGLLLGTKA